MEKLVLSNGAEYLLCTDGVNQYNDVATFKVRPMEGVTKTAEEVLADFTGNDTITAKVDDTAIQIITGKTVVRNVQLVPNFVIETKYVCPECGADVENTATTCTACNATFDGPTMKEVTATIFVVNVGAPDVNERLSSLEASVDAIGSTLLNMQMMSAGGESGDDTDAQAVQ